MLEPLYHNREVSDLEYLQTYSELQNKETAISIRSIALILSGLILGNLTVMGLFYLAAKAYFKF